MSKNQPFAIFQNLLLAARKERPDSQFQGCDEVLSFIYVRNASGLSVRITELVQYLEFGTGPTVHRKCRVLVERGLLTLEGSKDDGRVNILTISKAGHKYLAAQSALMLTAINEST